VKIDSSFPGAGRTSVDGKGTGVRVRRSEATDQPQASADVTHLNQNGEANATQDIDMARVAEIRQAISEGRLQLRPERIADGLIDSVKDLLGDAQS
jgi:negative regulator of flagellin synthesis FlgM